MKYIKFFSDIRIHEIGLVGGKNASLGEMISQLSGSGVEIPAGFAITAEAYWYFVQQNKIENEIAAALTRIGQNYTIAELQQVGQHIRSLIEQGTIPSDLQQEIVYAYHELSKQYNQDNCDVAVRSSATAEDLPTASFAGQQESFLNVQGDQALLAACKKCFASLFTDRAIIYRLEQGFTHARIGLSIGVQKMIRSDLSCSGVAFSLDTETGHPDMVLIEASYGLGEVIVKGRVIPDEFMVHKPTLAGGFRPIIKKKRGTKTVKMVYTNSVPPVEEVDVPEKDQKKYVLTNDEVLYLARLVCIIERYYSNLNGKPVPMDIEWAKDGTDGKIYIIQARPETVHAVHVGSSMRQYQLSGTPGKVIAQGQSIGQQIVNGKARLINDSKYQVRLEPGDILVTDMTNPDWGPIMSKAAGIITNRGGRTCHAAIVSRELNIPAIVGTHNATNTIREGQNITLDCSKGSVGFVYDGICEFKTTELKLTSIVKLPVELMVNVAHPETALHVSQLPVSGVGLARIEFIIAQDIQTHPMALLFPEQVTDQKIRQHIELITEEYKNKADFFVDTLARGIAMIAAAFYPRPVVVRLSDFKSNEYRQLIGGSFFEPVEENPMLGLRGASRYYHEQYSPAFALECAALCAVRTQMGMKNIAAMIPFVRTVDEAKKVLALMADHGIVRPDWNIIMMCEVPSNVILIDEFCALFNGISIGSNDLTQLTLGVDRDSALLSNLFNENDQAVRILFKQAITGAQRNKVSSGICGQAPSDYPEIAAFLIDLGIDSLSLNPDAIIPFLLRYANA